MLSLIKMYILFWIEQKNPDAFVRRLHSLPRVVWNVLVLRLN